MAIEPGFASVCSRDARLVESADRCVLGMRLVRLNRSDYDFAGVSADPDLQIHTLLGPEAFCVPPDVLLHPKRCVECALRVIFVRNRRAKQREDAIPG